MRKCDGFRFAFLREKGSNIGSSNIKSKIWTLNPNNSVGLQLLTAVTAVLVQKISEIHLVVHLSFFSNYSPPPKNHIDAYYIVQLKNRLALTVKLTALVSSNVNVDSLEKVFYRKV